MIRVELAQVDALADALRELRGRDLRVATDGRSRIIVSNSRRVIVIERYGQITQRPDDRDSWEMHEDEVAGRGGVL